MTKWPMVPLREIARSVLRELTVQAGTSYRTIGVKWWGEGAYERQTIDGSQTAASKLWLVKKDDLIINKIWVRHGSTAVASDAVDGCAASNEFPTFELDKHRVQPRWLHWLSKTRAFWRKCDALSMGTSGKNRIKPEKFLTIEIPLPTLHEQLRLVEHLDLLIAKIDEAKQLRQDAIRGLGVLDDQVATALIGDATWPLVTMEDLVGRANLKNGISLKSSPFHSNIRCLTLSSIRNGRIDTNESKPVPMDASEAGPYLVHLNDVYVVRGNGSKDLVGRAGIVEDVTNDVIFPDLLIKIPLNASRIMPEYFVTIWNSRLIRNRIEDLAKTTSGIWKVNQGHIASVQIPIPPLSVQAQIVSHTRLARLSCLEVLSLQRETESELNAILPAILDQIFNGDTE